MINKALLILATVGILSVLSQTSTAENSHTLPSVQWSAEELTRDVAVKTLRKTDHASFHFVRLNGAELPHIHDRHDLTVFTFLGTSVLHFKNRTVSLKPGDLIDIPRGVWHWAENIGQDPTLAYAVFTPPFDGKDRRVVAHP